MMLMMTTRVPRLLTRHYRPKPSSCMARSTTFRPPRISTNLINKVHRPLSIRSASSGAAGSASSHFQLLRVTGDGACLFRAIAQGDHIAKGNRQPLSESEEGKSARGLRLAVLKEMMNRRESIEPFIPGILDGDISFEAYIARMSVPFAWGGEPEMVMAMNVLQRPIHVWRIIEDRLEPIVSYGAEEFKNYASINLLWHQAGHYDALVSDN